MKFDDYIKVKGINASTLSLFKDNPNALSRGEYPKPCYNFELGHAFEAILYEECHGINGFFSKKWFISEKETPPKDELIHWIKSKEDLETKYVYNKPDKNGERKLSGTYKSMHYRLDECLDNAGKVPICKNDYQKLVKLANSMLNLEVEGAKVSTIIKKSKWQEAVFFEDKKCLCDLLMIHNNTCYVFDLKTTANFKQFRQIARQKYWVQACHYKHCIEGAKGIPCNDMIFLVASLDEEVVQEWRLHESKIEETTESYYLLIEDFRQWDWEVKTFKKPDRFWPDLRY